MTYVKSLKSSGPGHTLRNINIHTSSDSVTINVNGKNYYYPNVKSVAIDNDELILDGKKRVAPWAAHYDPAVDGIEPPSRSWWKERPVLTSIEVGVLVVPVVIVVTAVIIYLFG